MKKGILMAAQQRSLWLKIRVGSYELFEQAAYGFEA